MKKEKEQKPKGKVIQSTIPLDYYKYLAEQAKKENRSESSIIAQLLIHAIDEKIRSQYGTKRKNS